MIEFTNEEYKKRVEKLPQDLKDALRFIVMEKFIWNIWVDYKLDHNIADSFKRNIHAVLIGLLPPHKFKDELIKDGMDQDIAEKIAQKTHYYVFREAKKGLTEIYSDIKIDPKGRVIVKKEDDYRLSHIENPEKIKARKKEIEEYQENDPYAESL